MALDDKSSPNTVQPRSEYELGIIGLTDKTINLWGRRLPQYIVIVGIVGALLAALQGIVLYAIFGIDGIALLEFIGTSPLDAVFSLVLYTISPDVLIVIFLLSIISMIVYAIIAGAAIHYALVDYSNPSSGSIGESFSFAVEHASTLIVVQLIQSLIALSLVIVSVVLFYADLLISLVMMFLILYIVVRLAPVLAIVIAEERSPIDSLKRSWQITGGLFFHVFLAQMLIGFVVIILDIMITIGMAFVFLYIVPSLGFAVLFVTIISNSMVSSIGYIYLAVLYKDLEARGTTGGYNWWQ